MKYETTFLQDHKSNKTRKNVWKKFNAGNEIFKK